jgi:hypothetical protein
VGPWGQSEFHQISSYKKDRLRLGLELGPALGLELGLERVLGLELGRHSRQ